MSYQPSPQGQALRAPGQAAGPGDTHRRPHLGATQNAPSRRSLLGVVACVVFLTELVSNTASAALPVPIFLGVAASLGLPPPLFAAAIEVSASCAFMRSLARPPNAIVHATQQVPQATMRRCGLALNLVRIAAITAVATGVFA